MAEYTTAATQTVAFGQNVLFTETVVCGKNNVLHRGGSGIFTLRGSNNPCNPAKYEVEFGANIAVAEGGTVGPISLALALEGEALYSATATVTPAAIGDFFSISRGATITVPCGCCYTIALENVSDPATPIDVANANIRINRVC